MLRWRSAEQLLVNNDAYAPSSFPVRLESTGKRRVTREVSESGSMHRSGSAAFYRHQVTDCDCADCQQRAGAKAPTSGISAGNPAKLPTSMGPAVDMVAAPAADSP